jgi:hypothetical protein
VGIGQRPEHDCIHQAEDGRIGADSESQRRKRGRCNAGVTSQNTERMPKVLEHAGCVARGLPIQVARF